MSDRPLQSPLTILVVDDEPSMRKLMGSSLRRGGHTVLLAEDGVEGIAEFHREKVDLVITDYVMPHLGGDALAAAIKKHSPGTPVILTTGFQTPISGNAVDRRLQKPFTIDELFQAVADAVATVAK